MRRWLLSLCALTLSLGAFAQWNGDPTVNNPVILAANAPTNKSNLVGVSDLAGNAFFAWTEDRGNGQGIFVQKLNQDGSLAFDVAASPVFTLAQTQAGPITSMDIVPDLQGGVILVWQYNPTGSNAEIYGQRINALGVPVWETTGKPLFTSSVNQFGPKLTLLSNATEFAVMWREDRGDVTNGSDLYAQKYDLATGNSLWANEISLVAAPGTQTNYSIWPDAFGGFISVWEDPRNGTTTRVIYGQRVTNTGTKLWGTGDPNNGLQISDAGAYTNVSPSIVTDGASGILVVFQSSRTPATSSTTDIYGQRVTAAGARFLVDIPICTASGGQTNAKIMLSGSNAIVAWWDTRNTPTGRDFYAQSINLATATTNWPSAGMPIIVEANSQPLNNFQIVPDGDGSGVFIWDDARSGTVNETRQDIYAQRLNSITGAPSWAATGAPVATRANSNQGGSDFVVAPFSANNSIIVGWRDNRSNNTSVTTQEIYASQINLDGTLPVTLLDFNAVPAGEKITTKWQTTDEINAREFVVEKSGDGRNYYAIGSVKAKNTSGKNNYTFDDLRPLAGDNFYRLRAVDIDNRFEYSRIARVSMLRKLPAQVYAFPNPTSDMLKLQFNNFEKGVYQVRMVDVRGAVIMSRSMSVDAGLQQAEFSLSNLAAGRYFMQVIGNGRVVSVQPVQKQ